MTQEGKNMYAEWIMDSCRHIVHILEDLPGCKPDIDHLLELLPRLQPRLYSISSSSKVHIDSLHITAVVVEYVTKTGRKNNGVCTKWLQLMGSNSMGKSYLRHDMVPNKEFRIPCYVRRSHFRLPNTPQTSIIMVGPGTGLAPFRGFIQERAWQKRKGKPIGETHLYFGCRHQEVDYIYRDELEQYEKDGVLTLHTAFSRDQSNKIYVTHRIKENATDIWRLFEKEQAYFYICGEAKNMAKDVHNLILQIIKNTGNKSEEEAEAYLKRMEDQKRYSTDIWS